MARPTGVTRRGFLKGAGLTAVAATAVDVSCGTTPVAPVAQPAPVKVGPPAGAGAAAMIQTSVNGTAFDIAVDPRWTLAEMLRDQLYLTGTKVGCDRGECGSCTVVMDGKAILACSILATEAAGKKILTVESLSSDGKLSPLQQAFWDSGSAQCGFCIPGMLMSSTALLLEKPKPTEDEIRTALSGNLCRCTGYRKIVEGVLVASGQAPKA